MKLDVGVYRFSLYNESDSRVIPLWEVKLGNEKRIFCLILFNESVKQLSVIDKIKEILNNKDSYIDNTRSYRLAVIEEKSFNRDLKEIITDFKILDKDFIEILEYEEVREMFANKDNHKEMWELKTWKEN